MNYKSLIIILVFAANSLFAQTWDPIKKCVIDGNGECISNTILSAVPFLRINPDARTGGLGDAGVSLSPDPAAMHTNAARLAFVENDFSISATYSPWLRALGIDDIYLAYLSGYKKIDNLQTVGFAVRYFSLGEIPFTNEGGDPIGTGRPNEFEIAAAYARKLSDKLSASLAGKYIYSNLANGRTVGSFEISAGQSFAADLGLFYRDKMGSSGRRNYLNVGASITNIGSKITYIKGLTKDFIPTNLGVGATYEMNFDDFNSLHATLDINKLLIPTPTFDDSTFAYREKSLFEGILGSFGDAPGGFTEELQELMFSVGLEYWYDKQFAVRGGYFHEHALKGDRKYLTMGVGLKYNVFGLNISYLVPTTNNRSPLANTLRFSLIFDMRAFDAGSEN